MLFGSQSFAFQNDDLIVVLKESGECGQFRTQSQEAWGGVAFGNNAASYRDANFDNAFPNGLVIGCKYTLKFSTSEEIQRFLPLKSTASFLLNNFVDPVSFSNLLAGQLLALELSIGFDSYDKEFSSSDIPLKEMLINEGPFRGWTVAAFVIEANNYLGSCESTFRASDINKTLVLINENYLDGVMDGGYLSCPVDDIYNDVALCSILVDSVSSKYPVEIGDEIEILDLSGVTMVKYRISDTGDESYDLSVLELGTYIACWSGKMGAGRVRLVNE
jgi:hypothetical protein